MRCARPVHSRPQNRLNRELRGGRFGPHRMRYLTLDEMDWWYGRLRQIHEARGTRSTLAVRTTFREFIVNRGAV